MATLQSSITTLAAGIAFLILVGVLVQLNPLGKSGVRTALREAATVSFWAELAAIAIFLVMIGVYAAVFGGA